MSWTNGWGLRTGWKNSPMGFIWSLDQIGSGIVEATTDNSSPTGRELGKDAKDSKGKGKK